MALHLISGRMSMCTLQRAAATDEPEDANFIRKHAQEMAKEGHSQTAARLFSNPKGQSCGGGWGVAPLAIPISMFGGAV